MKRVRWGVALIIVSWLPIAQILLIIAHHSQALTSPKESNEFRLVVWALQTIIGFVGLWLVGKPAMASVRTEGIKRLPANMWRLVREGEAEKR